MKKRNPFRYLKPSPEVIRPAVMLYVRIALSPWNMKHLLRERGIDVSRELVKQIWAVAVTKVGREEGCDLAGGNRRGRGHNRYGQSGSLWPNPAECLRFRDPPAAGSLRCHNGRGRRADRGRLRRGPWSGRFEQAVDDPLAEGHGFRCQARDAKPETIQDDLSRTHGLSIRYGTGPVLAEFDR